MSLPAVEQFNVPAHHYIKTNKLQRCFLLVFGEKGRQSKQQTIIMWYDNNNSQVIVIIVFSFSQVISFWHHKDTEEEYGAGAPPPRLSTPVNYLKPVSLTSVLLNWKLVSIGQSEGGNSCTSHVFAPPCEVHHWQVERCVWWQQVFKEVQ